MNKKENLKFGFYILTMVVFGVSLVTLYKTLQNVDYISKTLTQRETTVAQLQDLYSELSPFLAAKQKLLSEAEKRDISDVNIIFNDLNIPYTSVEDDSIERENVSFTTQTVTVDNMKLADIKILMDTLIHEWPYINIQSVQIASSENGNAKLKIKLIFTKFL